MKQVVAILIFQCDLGYVRAQNSRPKTIFSYYTREKITLDGKLDESCCSQVRKISNFTQLQLTEGDPATEKTEVAIVYSPNKLYVGFWGYNKNPSKLIADQMKRDFGWGGDDKFEMIISTFNDNRNVYLFVTNPNAHEPMCWSRKRVPGLICPGVASGMWLQR